VQHVVSAHVLATALEMLAVVCSAGVRRADLQRATRLAGAAGLTEEQVAPGAQSLSVLLLTAWCLGPSLMRTARAAAFGGWRMAWPSLANWLRSSVGGLRTSCKAAAQALLAQTCSRRRCKLLGWRGLLGVTVTCAACTQVDIVFSLFSDKDGSLDCGAFLRALQRREAAAQYAKQLAHGRGAEDAPGLFACLRHCVTPSE